MRQLFGYLQSESQVGLPDQEGVLPDSEPLKQQDDELIEQAESILGTVDGIAPDRLKEPVVELGQALFWDKRLSANGKIACASCHHPRDWGADKARFSVDARGNKTKRNSQTVFNSTLQPGLRWVADRKSASHQAEKSLTGSMGFEQAEDVVPLLDKYDYAERFRRAFPDDETPLTPGNYGLAIEAYEATLRTPAAFDRYLGGAADSLTDQQKRGLTLFLEIGCIDCHSGPLLGGEGLQPFGVYHDYWKATGSDGRDTGLFETTQQESDRNVFRVSMLRNIAKTAPYFHDGSVTKLADAVRVMAKVQLDKELDDDQISALVSFLESLTGEIPKNYQDPSGSTSIDKPDLQKQSDTWKSSEFKLERS